MIRTLVVVAITIGLTLPAIAKPPGPRTTKRADANEQVRPQKKLRDAKDLRKIQALRTAYPKALKEGPKAIKKLDMDALALMQAEVRQSTRGTKRARPGSDKPRVAAPPVVRIRNAYKRLVGKADKASVERKQKLLAELEEAASRPGAPDIKRETKEVQVRPDRKQGGKPAPTKRPQRKRR